MKIVCEVCGKMIVDPKNACLCDYPVGAGYFCKSAKGSLEEHSTLKIKTVRCDKQMCCRCATEIAPKMHFCPKHARMAFTAIEMKRWELPPEVLKQVWVDDE